jgi:hypothetical protein
MLPLGQFAQILIKKNVVGGDRTNPQMTFRILTLGRELLGMPTSCSHIGPCLAMDCVFICALSRYRGETR